MCAARVQLPPGRYLVRFRFPIDLDRLFLPAVGDGDHDPDPTAASSPTPRQNGGIDGADTRLPETPETRGDEMDVTQQVNAIHHGSLRCRHRPTTETGKLYVRLTPLLSSSSSYHNAYVARSTSRIGRALPVPLTSSTPPKPRPLAKLAADRRGCRSPGSHACGVSVGFGLTVGRGRSLDW